MFEGERPTEVGLHDAHVGRPAVRDRAAQQIDAAAAQVGRHQQPAAFHRRGDGGGLAAGRRAGVEDARRRTIAGKQRDELRRFVLDEERSIGGVQLQRLSLVDDQRIGREGARMRVNLLRA